MTSATAMTHLHSVMTVWDLAHSAGAVVVDLNGAKADYAVGCTYSHNLQACLSLFGKSRAGLPDQLSVSRWCVHLLHVCGGPCDCLKRLRLRGFKWLREGLIHDVENAPITKT